MLTQITTMRKCGVFQHFDWNASIRDKGNNQGSFKDVNIFYGRNYSGKTTLSRIIRSLEINELHSGFEKSTFDLIINGQVIDQNHIDKHECHFRVFNSDFVRSHLKWLLDEDYQIKPFAIIGKASIDLERQIEEKVMRLGADENSGLLGELSQSQKQYEKAYWREQGARQQLTDRLTDKANKKIKLNSDYQVPTYNINKITADIDLLEKQPRSLLSSDEIHGKKVLLKEDEREDLEAMAPPVFLLSKLLEDSNAAIQAAISPTDPIQELLADPDLQEWVRQGIGHHEDKREDCAFCGNRLGEGLLKKLRSHFSKESEELRIKLTGLIEDIEAESNKINQIQFPYAHTTYSHLQDECRSLADKWEKESAAYKKSLAKIKTSVSERSKNIFKALEKRVVPDNSERLEALVSDANDIVSRHNSRSGDLVESKKAARTDLRLNEVAQFLQDIEYDEKKQQAISLQLQTMRAREEKDRKYKEAEALRQEIDKLRAHLKDERKGAERINDYLNHFFGNGNLRLVASEDDGDGCQFIVTRDGKEARDLSDGERNLIALCYFVARLEDTESDGKEPIVWIDDPVSSLDANHIFFVFSVIEYICNSKSLLNKSRCKQLFISTHNLEFLKYFHRLAVEGKSKEWFLVESRGQTSTVRPMPAYLREYATEFNYLFEQLYLCAQQNASGSAEDGGCYFNAGNNIRRFLEAYLFYKYPLAKWSLAQKIRKFFGDDPRAVTLVNRMVNELSHFGGDQVMRPIDIPELHHLAKYIIRQIEEKDSEQYQALLQSIDKGTKLL